MQRITLDSKTIRSVAYDVDTEILHVWLHKGRHVIHHNISEGVYRNLVTSEPPDFYYNFYIADERRPRGSAVRSVAKFASVCALGLLFLGVMSSEVRNVGKDTEITSSIK